MDAGRAPLASARTFATAIVATLALGLLSACGAPARVRTLDDEPDLARNGTTISQRLRQTCSLLDTVVRTEIRVRTLELTDGQCEWIELPSLTPAGRARRPGLFVGLVATSDGGATLDRTTTVLTRERAIPLGRERGVFDPETHTLYVLEHGRLWYLQRTGSRTDRVQRFLARLGSSLEEPRFGG
jgi:hypothetical protein